MAAPPPSSWEGGLDPEAYGDARGAAPGWDVYYLEREWRRGSARTRSRPRHPERHFVKFCRSWHEKRADRSAPPALPEVDSRQLSSSRLRPNPEDLGHGQRSAASACAPPATAGRWKKRSARILRTAVGPSPAPADLRRSTHAASRRSTASGSTCRPGTDATALDLLTPAARGGDPDRHQRRLELMQPPLPPAVRELRAGAAYLPAGRRRGWPRRHRCGSR